MNKKKETKQSFVIDAEKNNKQTIQRGMAIVCIFNHM